MSNDFDEQANPKPARAMFGAKRRSEPAQEEGPIAEALRQTEALLQVKHSPALDTLEEHSKRPNSGPTARPGPVCA